MPASDDAGRRAAPSGADRPGRRELWCLAGLCALAAARVFFGAAALPFFADNDEHAHFDLVHKFARGLWPDQRVTVLDEGTVKAMIYHASPEFLNKPKDSGDGPAFPPPVRDRVEQPGTKSTIHTSYVRFAGMPNHEAYEPPVYYALAAAWSRCGRASGLSEPSEVYWVRFLNVPLFAALVACAYAFCRPYFGRDVALGTAALTAFFPNTVFFTVSNDVPGPLAVLLALLLLVRWVERPGPGLAVAAGAMAAAALLVKLSNAAALAAVAVAVLVRARRAGGPGKALAEAWPLVLSAALPLLVWGLRNKLVLGGWTGTGGRLLVRGLTPKPWGELFDHPLFTPGGLVAFLGALCASFFRGDLQWWGEAVSFLPSKVFFQVSTALLPPLGLVAAFRRGRNEPGVRLAGGMAALVMVASVGELAVMSLLFRFKPNTFPSQDFPFYWFGRLASGALVPLLALYALGLWALTGRRTGLFAAGVAAAVVMMALGQWAYLKPTVASQYNWFHLP
jgi:hypothetical protein